jgi:predicted ATPase/DNA-binding CsgD family transcriptional regulator
MEAGAVKAAHMGPKVFFENLPSPLTPLVGREMDLQEARARLLRPQVRLLTLIGMMGVGKTRLALAMSSGLLEEFADGVCFVSLASVSDPDLLIPTIICTLGLPESSSFSPFKHLVSYLRDKQFLLLLDNFEHLSAAASLLPELLTACSRLKILVTSRVSLHIQGEYEFEVLPLTVPDLRPPSTYETLSQTAAVELFVQRVEALKPHFRLTEENAAIIAEICIRLEGLPLAIELAAARSKLLSFKALLSRLDDSLEVLSSGRQDVPSHQQTLRKTIAWSYDLLSAEQQTLFRRLCIFFGDFTLEAAETVVSTLNGTNVSVLDGISGLIDCSLLRCSEEDGREPRLHILEAVRAYGLEHLAASGELERCRNAHAAYYLALAENEAALDSTMQIAQLGLLEREKASLLPLTMLKSASLSTVSNELTTREIEVLVLVAMGMSNKQIAEQLVLSPNTVNTHIQSIYNKLNVGSRSAATRFAIEHHLI